MRHYVFKSPRHPGDRPVKMYEFEPMSYVLENLTTKIGPVEVLPEDSLSEEEKKVEGSDGF